MSSPACVVSKLGKSISPALNMMFIMGWKPRQTLGKNYKGLRKPISISTNYCYFGLGFSVDKLIDILHDKSNIDLSNILVLDNRLSSLFEEEDYSFTNSNNIIRSEVELNIFNRKEGCLVDTGSDITCISEAFWSELSSSVKEQIPLLPVKPIQTRGAVGQKSTKIQQIVMLPLKIGNLVIDTSFLLVPNLIHPIILGLDWLKNNEAQICFDKPSSGVRINVGGNPAFTPFIAH